MTDDDDDKAIENMRIAARIDVEAYVVSLCDEQASAERLAGRHGRADAYERGRADERADVVACLGDFARITGGPVPIATIERGGHVGTARKGKP